VLADGAEQSAADRRSALDAAGEEAVVGLAGDGSHYDTPASAPSAPSADASARTSSAAHCAPPAYSRRSSEAR